MAGSNFSSPAVSMLWKRPAEEPGTKAPEESFGLCCGHLLVRGEVGGGGGGGMFVTVKLSDQPEERSH